MHKLFIYEVPTVYARRMAGFYLYVSNTTSKENGHLCFHENQTKHEMILENISINCSVSGRYVIYYNERRRNVKYHDFYSMYAYNELCEVEVYGEFNACNSCFINNVNTSFFRLNTFITTYVT